MTETQSPEVSQGVVQAVPHTPEVTEASNGHVAQAPQVPQEVPSVPQLQIKTFSATHVKHLALLMLNILQDDEVQRAFNFALNNPDKVRENALPLMRAFLGASLQQAVEELDRFLASLLDMSIEEFGNQDAEVYFTTIEALVSHPKFDSFLRSGRGMFGVIGSKWSTYSSNDTAGQTNTSNP